MSTYKLLEWKNDTNGARYYDKGEVVTCEDCKWSIPSGSKVKGIYECTMVFGASGDMRADDFCSKGEKKDD